MKITRILVVLLAVISLYACKSDQNPEEVTEKFMKHLFAAEFNEAQKYGTESTQQMMQMFEAVKSLGGDMVDENMPEENIENVECDITGDTAICRFTDPSGEEGELNLVKEDGKWLVDMKKENPFGEEGMDLDDEALWDMDAEVNE